MSGKKANDTGGDIILLTTAESVLDADMIEAMLKDNGIPVFRQYYGADLHFRIIFGRVFEGVDIFVPAAAFEKAKELARILLNSPIDFDGEMN